MCVHTSHTARCSLYRSVHIFINSNLCCDNEPKSTRQFTSPCCPFARQCVAYTCSHHLLLFHLFLFRGCHTNAHWTHKEEMKRERLREKKKKAQGNYIGIRIILAHGYHGRMSGQDKVESSQEHSCVCRSFDSASGCLAATDCY